jgi:hypothetical protein
MWLKKNNIKYISQQTFDGCKDINLLPFDFYLPDYNVCIEYQGEQHYNKRCFDNFNHYSFEKRILHDQIKRDFCNSHGIKEFEISYKDYNNIDKILRKELYDE